MVGGIFLIKGVGIEEPMRQKYWDMGARFVAAPVVDNPALGSIINSCNWQGFAFMPVYFYDLQPGAGVAESQAYNCHKAINETLAKSSIKKLPVLLMFDNSTGVFPETTYYYNQIKQFLTAMKSYEKDRVFIVGFSPSTITIFKEKGLDPTLFTNQSNVYSKPFLYSPKTDMSWSPWVTWLFRGYSQRQLPGVNPFGWVEFPWTEASYLTFVSKGTLSLTFDHAVTATPPTPTTTPPTTITSVDFEKKVLDKLDTIINLLEKLNTMQ